MGVDSTLMVYLLQKPSPSSIILGREAHHVNLGTHQHSDSSVHVTIEKAHLSTKGRTFLGPSVVGQLAWFFATVLQNNWSPDVLKISHFLSVTHCSPFEYVLGVIMPQWVKLGKSLLGLNCGSWTENWFFCSLAPWQLLCPQESLSLELLVPGNQQEGCWVEQVVKVGNLHSEVGNGLPFFSTETKEREP